MYVHIIDIGIEPILEILRCTIYTDISIQSQYICIYVYILIFIYIYPNPQDGNNNNK